jgi:hypothetical protein
MPFGGISVDFSAATGRCCPPGNLHRSCLAAEIVDTEIGTKLSAVHDKRNALCSWGGQRLGKFLESVGIGKRDGRAVRLGENKVSSAGRMRSCGGNEFCFAKDCQVGKGHTNQLGGDAGPEISSTNSNPCITGGGAINRKD